jgi:hypothetical protein
LPPTSRPLPRFIAEPPHELAPYGRWEESLAREFRAACERLEHEEAAPTGDIAWYPQRTHGGLVYVPASAPAGDELELFGYVSFAAGPNGEPGDLRASVDYTDEIAAANPDWQVDLNDEVIGGWRGSGTAQGSLTLIWGSPLVPGAAIATAELDGETVDQCEIGADGRFTLVALDAVTGLGDELYVEVGVWSDKGDLLATESLYAPDE